MDDRELDTFVEEIAAELRRPVRIDASFDAKVMAALEPAVLPMRDRSAVVSRRVARPTRSWLLRPHTFSLTPLAGLAVAATIAGIAALGLWRTTAKNTPASSPSVPLVQVANAARGRAFQTVPFMLAAPGAKSVVIVGDFNAWDANATQLELRDGVWSTSVLLQPGRHEYQFIVDGKWVQD